MEQGTWVVGEEKLVLWWSLLAKKLSFAWDLANYIRIYIYRIIIQVRIKWLGESASKRARFTAASSLLCFIQSIFLAFFFVIRFIFFSLLAFFLNRSFHIFFFCFFFFFWKLWILRLTRWDSGLVKVTTAPWSRLALIVAAAFLTPVV